MCKTDYGGGGGGKNVLKIDYVICERPLSAVPSSTSLELVLRIDHRLELIARYD